MSERSSDDTLLNGRFGVDGNGVYVVGGSLVVAVIVAGFLAFSEPVQTVAVSKHLPLPRPLHISMLMENTCVHLSAFGDTREKILSALRTKYGEGMVAVPAMCPNGSDLLVFYKSK